MSEVSIDFSSGAPRTAVRLSWEEWRYLMRCALRLPTPTQAQQWTEILIEDGIFADDRVMLRLPDGPSNLDRAQRA